MPIIKSAKKRLRQSIIRRERNYPIKSKMKSVMKTTLDMIKDGKLEEAKKQMPRAFSIIDVSCKKNLIHKNTAARKKSRIARELNELESRTGVSSGVATKEEKAA